jgi:hypothetical protein
MKSKRFSEKRIIAVLKESEAGRKTKKSLVGRSAMLDRRLLKIDVFVRCAEALGANLN